MTPRRRRMMFVALILLAVGTAAALTLTALKDNVAAYYDPTAIADGKAPANRVFRMGGMVEQGSVKREPGSLAMQFDVTDYKHEMTVHYSGVLPDLFREGQGVMVRGKLAEMNGKREFVAEEVLAKHDENYMPPEVAASLKKSHDTRRGVTQ